MPLFIGLLIEAILRIVPSPAVVPKRFIIPYIHGVHELLGDKVVDRVLRASVICSVFLAVTFV